MNLHFVFSVEALEIWRAAFNFLLVAATCIVALGVYLEKEGHPEDVKRYGWALVTLGVAAEFLFMALLWQADSELDRRADVALASLRQKAADAELELAKLKKPRIIKANDAASLVADLHRYAGNEFWIITQKGDVDVNTEQQRLAKQLLGIFVKAGWHKDNHWSRRDLTKTEPEYRPISDRGCAITFAAESKSAAIGKVVLDGLKASGIECQMLPDNEIKLGRLDIEIGLR